MSGLAIRFGIHTTTIYRFLQLEQARSLRFGKGFVIRRAIYWLRSSARIQFPRASATSDWPWIRALGSFVCMVLWLCFSRISDGIGRILGDWEAAPKKKRGLLRRSNVSRLSRWAREKRTTHTSGLNRRRTLYRLFNRVIRKRWGQSHSGISQRLPELEVGRLNQSRDGG